MISRQQATFFDARGRVESAMNDLDQAGRKSYLNAARQLAADTHNLGLLQSIAFILARGETPEKRLLDDIAATLGFAAGDHAPTNGDALLNHLLSCPVLEYVGIKRLLLDQVLVAYVRLAQVRLAEGELANAN